MAKGTICVDCGGVPRGPRSIRCVECNRKAAARRKREYEERKREKNGPRICEGCGERPPRETTKNNARFCIQCRKSYKGLRRRLRLVDIRVNDVRELKKPLQGVHRRITKILLRPDMDGLRTSELRMLGELLLQLADIHATTTRKRNRPHEK